MMVPAKASGGSPRARAREAPARLKLDHWPGKGVSSGPGLSQTLSLREWLWVLAPVACRARAGPRQRPSPGEALRGHVAMSADSFAHHTGGTTGVCWVEAGRPPHNLKAKTAPTKHGLAPNVTSGVVGNSGLRSEDPRALLIFCVLKMDAHFPGLASSFIRQINEAIQQKGMTPPCADPVEEQRSLERPPFCWRRRGRH